MIIRGFQVLLFVEIGTNVYYWFLFMLCSKNQQVHATKHQILQKSVLRTLYVNFNLFSIHT